MKEYNQKIIVRNYVVPKQYYSFMKDYIVEILKYLGKEILKWDFELNVYIIKNKEEGVNAEVLVQNKKYRLNLYESLILKLNHGAKRVFNYVILHEFFHLFDMQMALDCEHTKARVDMAFGATKKEFYIKKGFRFWMEVNAYEAYFSGVAKKEIDNPTTFQIMTNLKRTDKFANVIYNYKGQPPKKMYINLEKAIDNIFYNFTKYIAKRRLFGKKEKYSKKTKSTSLFKAVKAFTKELEMQLKVIDKEPFGENFDKIFGDLGKSLFRFFYKPLGFEIAYVDKKLTLSCNL